MNRFRARLLAGMLLAGQIVIGGCASSGSKPAASRSDAGPPIVASTQANAPVLTPIPDENESKKPAAPANASNRTAAPADPIVAHLNGKPIPLSRLERPLIEGYGLNVLLNIVQLDTARAEAARSGATVTPQDVEHEREWTLGKLFQDADKSEYDQLFEQFLAQQKVSRAEFDIVLETNANLRKIAEPMVVGKINDAALEEAFRQLYGETIQVRHIELANMQEVVEAKRRLAAGEPFEKVAEEMSRNVRTRGLGGELPPFSRQAGGYPQAFKDAAFALKEGEVSDAVQAEGAFHLIKLEHRIPPKAVKFEDVKESIRKDLTERLVQTTIKQLRAQLAQDALRALVVDDPTLKAQFDDKLHNRDQQIRDRNQIREQFERERERILNRPATSQPASSDVTGGGGAPTTSTTPAASAPPAPEVARPPATRSETPDVSATSPTTRP